MMCKYLLNPNFFPATSAAAAMGPWLDKKYEGKNDHGFVIPAQKLVHFEIFRSIGRLFKPGDVFDPSPLFAFSQFPLGINIKRIETRH